MKVIATILTIVTAFLAIACGGAQVKSGPTTRDRAQESFQQLEQEEAQHPATK